MKVLALAAALIALGPSAAAAPRGEARIQAALAEAAAASGLPTGWIREVMRRESAGEARAISNAGALGLMQLMPATWAALRDRLGLGADPFDIHDNLLGGAVYLRELLDRFGAPGFLAAYNAGPTRYAEALAGRARLPLETLAYVARLAPRIEVEPKRTARRRAMGLTPRDDGLFAIPGRSAP